ncbi:lactate utilization protein C [Deinococcus sp.]|uniref:LutC/YkgG family protein n=1 Tax=Deinococcus sp. TaxID=47478 RepID=UPI0025C6A009|nr:lactate utilization protein C [Deinococcus sp.]
MSQLPKSEAPRSAEIARSAEARLEVLTRINRAVAGTEVPELPAYPQSAPLSREEIVEQFEDRILDYRAAFTRVAAQDVPGAIGAALGEVRRVVVPAEFSDAWLPAGIDVVRDAPLLSHAQLDGIPAVITGCAVAISETGTIILDHQGDQGRRALSLIPDIHICVIRAGQVVQTVREGTEQVAPSVRAGRPLTWLSGGSATSDIELVRVEGVHGPRHLKVIVVDG